jgi:DNA-binding IclR family transcriptional regulator
MTVHRSTLLRCELPRGRTQRLAPAKCRCNAAAPAAPLEGAIIRKRIETGDVERAAPERIGGANLVAKIGAILDLYRPERASLSVMNVAEELAIPRTSAYRLLSALVATGYLRRDEVTRLYCMGGRVLNLARTYEVSRSLTTIARPHLQAMHAKINENVAIFVREGNFRYAIEGIETTHRLRLALPLGERLPLGRAAAGRVLTLTGAQARLAAGNAASVVFSRREVHAKGWAVAAPVLDGEGNLAAALAVAAPLDRFTAARRDRYVTLVFEYAGKISLDLGWHG